MGNKNFYRDGFNMITEKEIKEKIAEQVKIFAIAIKVFNETLEEELAKTDLDEETKDLVRDCAVLGMATSMGGAIEIIRREINE